MREAEVKCDIQIEEGLKKRLRGSSYVLVLYPTLKFSCLISKRFKAQIGMPPENGKIIEVDGVKVCVIFKVIGSRFCGDGFEEFEFPVVDPEKFYPRWIRVKEDLSGDFGYL